MIFAELDKKAIFMLFALTILIPKSGLTQNKRILWLGNSYTAYNNLPSMFYNLALSGGDTITFDANTPGGFTLSAHASNQTSLNKIGQGNWDYVIIQAQSQEPSFPPSQVNSQTLPYAIELDSLIHAASPCAKTVFYMTWGRKYGDSQNCGNYPPLCTFEGMNDRLRWGYKTMADETEGIIAPVGSSWKNAWYADSTTNLWNADLSHPSPAGSYLAACTFYSTILRKPSLGLSYIASLDANTATFFQGIADNTVNDSLEVWNIGRFEPEADFSYIAEGLQYNFQHEASNAETFTWDFGDGNTSELPAPFHEYSGEGDYTVSLIAGSNCLFDTSEVIISVTITDLNTAASGGWRIFPNPATNMVMIQSSEPEQFHIAVYSINGKLVSAFDEEGSLINLDFSEYEKGIYQIVCSTRTDQRIFRILKD